MRLFAGFILLALFSSFAGASILTPIEKKQRKLVSRFYEVLEMMPDRCPETVRENYLKSVKSFEKAFPEFISLVNKSNFRAYAISKYSNKSAISESECLYLKEGLDAHVNTEKGKKSMSKNTDIMRSNNENT